MDFHVDEYGDGDPEVVGELVTEDDDDRGFELPEGYVMEDADNSPSLRSESSGTALSPRGEADDEEAAR
jgi:hypothetical protein